MKVKVTILQQESATFDIGDLPINLVKDLLKKNDGSFDGNWSIADVTTKVEYETTAVTVEEV